MGIDEPPILPPEKPVEPEVTNETVEKIPTKEEILKLLEINGHNPETIAFVTKWTEERERQINTARDGVILNIDRIEFYLAIGDAEGAYECAKDALINAMNEGEEDLIERIQKIFPEIS